MLKKRIKNLFILILFMIIFDGFIYYKTGSLSPSTIKNNIFVIGVYLITCLIIYIVSREKG
ncbi:hypothetical protein [uncultured Peptoniphilus sp.]|uniref:hypothetical protein n=1 Tax=uncultured Peptoniphilus sp. TaxID=254354 RepID=UPI001E06461A|nr:hypothetical protein [uncultured Peptoniphilus sp.]MBS4881953.1 hypothetical protein [Peptoniphilus harei]MDU6783323.1 hypothetical protein [Peptoniphilus harei]